MWNMITSIHFNYWRGYIVAHICRPKNSALNEKNINSCIYV